MPAASIANPHRPKLHPSADLSVELPDVRIPVASRPGSPDHSTIGLILCQIGRYPLLKLEQEQILSCQVAQMRLLNRIQEQTGGVLSRHQWAEAAGISPEHLDVKLRQGAYARQMMGGLPRIQRLKVSQHRFSLQAYLLTISSSKRDAGFSPIPLAG